MVSQKGWVQGGDHLTIRSLQAASSTCSMAMCSLMLMSVIKMSRGLTSQEEEARFLSECLEFART